MTLPRDFAERERQRMWDHKRTQDQSPGAQRYADWLANHKDSCTFGEYLRVGPPEPDNDCHSCIGTGIGDPHSQSRCWSCKGTGVNQSERGASRWE